MERATGFEPATSTLGRWHSTAELRPRALKFVEERVCDRTTLLVQSPLVAFKHNLPIPAVILVLLAAGLAALVLFHTPPEEDQIRQAIDKYVATLGPVKQMEIHGAIADILLTENNHLIYAEFEKKNG